MKNDHPKVAERVTFKGYTFNYKSSKSNVLVYVCEPEADYYGEYSDGYVLIVQYDGSEKVKGKDKYKVIHFLETNKWGVETINISSMPDRHAVPVDDQN